MPIKYNKYYYVRYGYGVSAARCVLAAESESVFAILLSKNGPEFDCRSYMNSDVFGEVKDADLPLRRRIISWWSRLWQGKE